MLDKCVNPLLKRKNKMCIINQYLNSSNDTNFVLTINTVLGTGSSFTLPLPSGQTYDLYWDPGDGSGEKHVIAYNDVNITHTYSSAYNGQVKIRGKCGGWSFNNTGDKLKITSVDNWGNVDFDYITNGFYGCTNLASIQKAEIPVTSSCLSFGGTFRNCYLLTKVYAELFRRGVNVTSFSSTWNTCIAINEIENDAYRYNINATTFQNCHQLNYALLTLPEDLHYYNSLCLNYSFEFYNARNISLPSRIFNMANINIVTNFNSFMEETNTIYSNTGTIQDVWNYALSATHLNAFKNQTALTNYASILNDWKGL